MSVATTSRDAIKASVQLRLRFDMTNAQSRWTEADINEAIKSGLRALHPLGDDRRIVVHLDASGLDLSTGDGDNPAYHVNAVRSVVIRDASVPVRQETLRPPRWSFYPNQAEWFQLEDGIKPGTSGSFDLLLRIIERYNENSESLTADPEALMLYVLAWLCGQEMADGQDSDREMYGRMAMDFRIAADTRRQALLLMQYPELRPPEKKSGGSK